MTLHVQQRGWIFGEEKLRRIVRIAQRDDVMTRLRGPVQSRSNRCSIRTACPGFPLRGTEKPCHITWRGAEHLSRCSVDREQPALGCASNPGDERESKPILDPAIYPHAVVLRRARQGAFAISSRLTDRVVFMTSAYETFSNERKTNATP